MEIREADLFCGHCGDSLSTEPTKSNEDVFHVLMPSFVYYFGTLVLLAAYKLTSLFPDDFEGFLLVNTVDILIVLIFAGLTWKELKPLFSFSGFKFSTAGLTVVGALAGSVVISWLADLINVVISDDVFYDTFLFQQTSSPFLFATIFICVQPAFFEEIAFRGFLYSNIRKVSAPAGTIYITSFIFAIIHLAVVSMLWLVPIGLALAFLRMKYGTLWYGVMGHFTYNFGIILLEFYQLHY